MAGCRRPRRVERELVYEARNSSAGRDSAIHNARRSAVRRAPTAVTQRDPYATVNVRRTRRPFPLRRLSVA